MGSVAVDGLLLIMAVFPLLAASIRFADDGANADALLQRGDDAGGAGRPRLL